MQHFDQFYKSWNFFTGCYTFDNFFQTEGNGQNSAEFIDFRKQLLPHSKQKQPELPLFLVFMINLLVKQPQRGINMKWSTSKSSFRILNLSISVPCFAAKRNVACSKWKILIYSLHFAAKNGNWKYMNLIFVSFWKIFVYSTSFSSQKWSMIIFEYLLYKF